MDIAFLNNDLEALCLDERMQKRKLGAIGAKRLRARLADLDAVTRVSELVAGRPHPLIGDRRGEFALDLDGGRRLVFEPVDASLATRDDDSIDWARVTRVRITYIGNYHD